MSQVDYFLKIEGIEGESEDSKHKGEIDVDGYSWGATQSGTASHGGGGGAGKVSMQDFKFVMKANKASPKLWLACALGSHIKEATLTCRKAGEGQQEYLVVTLSDVIVSSYQTSGSADSNGDSIPTDICSLNFAKLEFEYKPQKEDGSLAAPVKTGFDTKRMQKV